MDTFWKNKYITAYIALKHHTRFILPIMEFVKKAGAKTNYLVAQAERSQEITAIESNLDYSHIFDFIEDCDKDDVQQIYLNLRDTFGKTLVKDIAFTLQANTVLDKTLYSTAQEYVAFKNYFKKHRPDVCLALHEVNRWGKMFAFHAKKAGVPLITLQEGLLTTSSAYLNFQMTGHVQFSALCFVWGKNTKKTLINFEAPEDKIIPVGNTHLSTEIQKLKENNVRKIKRKAYDITEKFAVLLLFSATITPLEEVIPIFSAAKGNKNLTLITKFHPATTQLTINNWMTDLPDKIKKYILFIHGEENTYNLMAMSDLCVLSEGSTTGLEALAIGKPVVLLRLKSAVVYQSNLVEENAAIDLTPEELALSLSKKTDFSQMMDKKGVKNYISNEICQGSGSVEYAADLMQSVIRANQNTSRLPLNPNVQPDMDFSIILPVSNDPQIFLTLLEAISVHSQDEFFEIILIKPASVSQEIDTILQSLEGDIVILEMENEKSMPEMMNRAGQNAKGKNLLFLNKNIAPKAGWLSFLKQGIAEFGNKKFFGAHIINTYKNIVHSGMVLNANCQPVSAYLHLDENFPHTCKSRPFQMVDHVIGVERNFFLSTGGFDKRSGDYLFLDLCLNVIDSNKDPNIVIYLDKVKLLMLSPLEHDESNMDAVYFYSRWHKTLWESETSLLEKDGVSMLQIDAARMTRAMEISNINQA